MTYVTAKGWTSRRVAVVTGVVPATIGAAALYALVFREWDAWLAWFAVEPAIAGALVGNLVWLCVDVRHRIRRAGAILASLCLAAWAIFLLFGAPHEGPPPSPRSDGSFEFHTHPPVMVAGRAVGTFGAVNAADRLVIVLAFPAIGHASLAVGLATGTTIGEHTVAQSYVVAGIGAVLSCAWWLAVGDAVAAFRRRGERRAGVPATTT